MHFCDQHKVKNVALNVNFKDAINYFKFRRILRKSVDEKIIKITLFLNKIMEVTDAQQINQILQNYHETLMGGHSGLERMKNTIKKFYNWPNMTKDIKNYIGNCPKCEKIKINKHTRMPMQISSTAERPFQKIYIDLVGPITPMSSEGNNYIFSCNCELSKYAIASPMRDCSALTTAKAFIHETILKFVFPEEIVTGNGTNFISQTMVEVSKILKIKKTLTTPYHPQSNQVERYHRSLSTYLKAFIKDDPMYWDAYLDYATFSYNITENTTTGFSPFEIVFGHSIKLPISITGDRPTYNYENYVQELKNKLKNTHQLAQENILARKQNNKLKYDKLPIKSIHLKKNDLAKNKKNHKFDDSYDGPFRVEKILSPVTAIIKRKKKSYKIHVNRLKLATADYGDTPPLLN